jgi:hypothetical protein
MGGALPLARRQPRRSKAVAAKDLLTLRREHEKCQVERARGDVFEHRQAIFRPSGHFERHSHDLEFWHLLQPQLGAGAVSDNDIDVAGGERSNGAVLAFGQSVVAGATDDLLRFFSEAL